MMKEETVIMMMDQCSKWIEFRVPHVLFGTETLGDYIFLLALVFLIIVSWFSELK